MDVVRDKAWLLEDHVKQLERQTKDVKNALMRNSARRRVVMFLAVLSSIFAVGYGVNHFVSSNDGH